MLILKEQSASKNEEDLQKACRITTFKLALLRIKTIKPRFECIEVVSFKQTLIIFILCIPGQYACDPLRNIQDVVPYPLHKVVQIIIDQRTK